MSLGNVARIINKYADETPEWEGNEDELARIFGLRLYNPVTQ